MNAKTPSTPKNSGTNEAALQYLHELHDATQSKTNRLLIVGSIGLLGLLVLITWGVRTVNQHIRNPEEMFETLDGVWRARIPALRAVLAKETEKAINKAVERSSKRALRLTANLPESLSEESKLWVDEAARQLALRLENEIQEIIIADRETVQRLLARRPEKDSDAALDAFFAERLEPVIRSEIGAARQGTLDLLLATYHKLSQLQTKEQLTFEEQAERKIISQVAGKVRQALAGEK